MEFSDLQKDALTEIVNIGVGKAASALNELIGNHIELTVPHIEYFPREHIQEVLDRFGQDAISAVVQSFAGETKGRAALVFPPDDVINLVTSVTGEQASAPEMDAIKAGALMEIGNIVINAILGSMSNLLDFRFNFELPEYRETKIGSLVRLESDQIDSSFILLAEASFTVSSLNIHGYILLLFQVDSLNSLGDYINKKIESLS